MSNIEKYYDNTEIDIPHKNVEEFIKTKTNVGNAIELGCGAGSDTVYLIKHGWNVLAMDKEDTEERIAKRLNKEELEKFRFKKQEFENILLEKTNLIVANFSLPFCNKNEFYQFWEKITNSILENGYFIGNFFGINDEWKKVKSNMVFLNKKEVLELFSKVDIITLKETEKDAVTGMGEMKHWHIFDVIAKKK